MSKTQLQKEAKRLSHSAAKNETRILVNDQLFDTILTNSDPAEIDCVDVSSAEAVMNLITGLQRMIEYFRNGRPMPITGMKIIPDETR